MIVLFNALLKAIVDLETMVIVLASIIVYYDVTVDDGFVGTLSFNSTFKIYSF